MSPDFADWDDGGARARFRFNASWSVHSVADIVAALAERGFRVWLIEGGALVFGDERYRPGEGWPRSPPDWLAEKLWKNADAVARLLEDERRGAP
jgi:hypothetical protein